MTNILRKPLFWIGSTRRDLKTFPDEVQDMMGHALDIAQQGKKHQDAKPLAGFGDAGVLEIVEDHAGDTYRAVYTVRFAGAVYALHAFQKVSVHPLPPTPSHVGEGEFSNPLFHKAPSPLVGEGWGEGCERLLQKKSKKGAETPK